MARCENAHTVGKRSIPSAREEKSNIRCSPNHASQSSCLQVDRKGKKNAWFLDDEETASIVTNTTDSMELPVESGSQIYDICGTISQQFKAGNCMGMLSCAGYDYVIFDEYLGGRDLIPLRQILPCFRNGEPIPMKQK